MVYNFQQGMMAGAASGAGGGYSVSNSIVMDDGSSQYLTGSTLSGGSERIGTYSFWTKRANLGTQQEIYTQYRTSSSNMAFRIRFLSGDTLDIVCENDAGGVILRRTTTQVFRDPHAFLHVHIQINGNQTDDTCCTLTINGSAVSDFSTKTNLSSGTDLNLFTSSKSAFIGSTPGPAGYYDGYFSEFVAIDNNNAAATSFGEYDTKGVWRPINVSGLTFGTNGFYLDFAASGDLGNDVSGNANDFTTSGSPTQSSSTPTNVYPTLSPLLVNTGKVTLSEGNLKTTSSTSSGNVGNAYASFEMPTSGKWYWETTVDTVGVTPSIGWGSKKDASSTITTNSAFINVYINGASGGTNGKNYYGSDLPSTGTGTYGNMTVPWTNGMVIGVAYDADNQLCWFSQDGTWIDGDGSASSATVLSEIEAGTSGSECFSASIGGIGQENFVFRVASLSISSFVYTVNFGDKAFAYSAPSGFSTLNTTNLYTNAAPAIEDGTAYFQASTYTGTGSARDVIQSENSQFTPDLVWVKERGGLNEHRLIDAVRGATETVYLGGALGSAAEATESTGVTSFNSNPPGFGFSVGTGGGYNNLGDTYVGWQWKGDGTSGSSNGDGDITTTVNVDQTSGFSIVNWLGDNVDLQTIGHGLGATPSMMIYRKREGSQWFVQHAGLTGGIDNGTSTKQLILDGADPEGGPFSGGYIDTVGSSTVRLKKGSSSMNNCNASGDNYMAYMFAEIPGYSAFGSFKGNGVPDGPLIQLDFKPAYIMFKNTNVTGSWAIFDIFRSLFNPVDDTLIANGTDVEVSGSDDFDFLANGVKVRSTWAAVNGSGNTIIYAAFAEHPFAGTTPATAR